MGITFDKDEVGRFPSGWESENQKNLAKVYKVQAEGGENKMRSWHTATAVPPEIRLISGNISHPAEFQRDPNHLEMAMKARHP